MATTGQDVLFAQTTPYNKWTFRFRVLMGAVSGFSVYYFTFLLLSWSFPSFSGFPVVVLEKIPGVLGVIAFFAVTEKLEKIWYGDRQEWWADFFRAVQNGRHESIRVLLFVHV